MSFNHKNYNFYILAGNCKLPFFDSDKGDYVVARHKKSKKWGFLHLKNGKYIRATRENYYSPYNGGDSFDRFVKDGGWVEVQIKNAGYQIV